MDCVVMVGRYRSLFKGGSVKFTDGEGNVELVVPIPNDVVLRDVCGNIVLSDYVMLLALDGGVWGVVCEDYRRKYHHNKPVLSYGEYLEAVKGED